MIWGETVKLAPMKVEDVVQMLHWEKHNDILFADYNFPMWNEKEVQRWFYSKTRGNKECFSIFDREAKLIGYIALRKINPFLKTGEIGILLRPQMLGKKFGREALQVFLKWVFEIKGMKKIRLSVAKYNTRAIRCYRAVGFYTKRTFHDICFNDAIHPFEERGYEGIKQYFREVGNTLFVEYDEMEISAQTFRQSRKYTLHGNMT